jgi:hypothetical protein
MSIAGNFFNLAGMLVLEGALDLAKQMPGTTEKASAERFEPKQKP